jgi:UDP:flavonoid glycosyltransferase YjiC (YdhE family)
MVKKLKLLFISECVTLAHIARPFALASSLDLSRYDITLAWNRTYPSLFPSLPFKERIIKSMNSSEFTKKLKQGSILYDSKTLENYIQEDELLLNEVKPDLVIGDFRLSLAISARAAKIPWANLANAYWSSGAKPKFIVPDLSLVNFFGEKVAQKIFSLVQPAAFSIHALPLYRLMKKYGIQPPSLNIADMYIQGDYTLFCDSPFLIPANLNANQRFIGPVLWHPPVSKPRWWSEALKQKPLIYVTLGSSGNADFLPSIIHALQDLPVSVLVATANDKPIPNVKDNVYQSSYLPGLEAAAASDLVICNGGSPTTQQALSSGVPVLGIPSNLDQYLNMFFVEKSGVGQYLRAGLLNSTTLKKTVENMLLDQELKNKALKMKELFSRTDATSNFKQFLENHFK